MPLVINGATSGSTTIQATDAVTATITLPSTTGTVQLSGTAGSFTDLTTTGNTILGDASTDTLNVGNGGLIKDASGNVGIGVTPSAWFTNRKALQLGGNTSSVLSLSSGVGEILYNSYINTSGQLVATTTNYIGYHDFNNKLANGYTWGISAASVTAGNIGTVPTSLSLDNSGNLAILGALSFASFLGGLGKVGNFIRNTSVGTGTVAYTGVGFKPSTIIFFATIDTVAAQSMGFTDASNGRCLWIDSVYGSGGANYAKAIRYLRTIAGNGTIQEAVISTMDSDGFTLSWTRTDVGSGGTANNIIVNYLAFR